MKVFKFLSLFQNALPKDQDFDENVQNYFKVDENGKSKNDNPPDLPREDINDDFDMSDDDVKLAKRDSHERETDTESRIGDRYLGFGDLDDEFDQPEMDLSSFKINFSK